jgi:multidrug efflux pump subunit AcrA (membrane-fusion protein)
MLYIPENEVSKIKVGQETEYIFDAMPYNEYGKITGEIVSISADSVANESARTKFYIAQADLSALSPSNDKGDVREVKTGMIVEAKIISGSKKVIVWLLQKINLMD